MKFKYLSLQQLDFWKGDMVISLAKQLPAGLHLYETFKGTEERFKKVQRIVSNITASFQRLSLPLLLAAR